MVGEQNANYHLKLDLPAINRIKAAESNSDFGLVVEPIIITEEMLEKNGWTSNKKDHTLKGCHTWKYRYERNGFDYTFIYKLDDYFTIESWDDRVYRLYETQYCRKWSIDKLQKTLRLCGFQDLADRFSL